MRIREDVVTRATPERAWELLSDPTLHAQWNPRIVDTVVSSPGSPGLGFRYRVTYEMSGRRNEFDAEVTVFSPPFQFVARLEERVKGDGRNWQSFVEDTYALSRRGEATYVRHEMRIHDSGLNIFVRLLIELITRTGRPRGATFMDKFAEIAERGDSTRAA